MAPSSSDVSLFLTATVFLLVFHYWSAIALGHPGGWEMIRNLRGCQQGEHRQGLAELKGYLHHFGYLPVTPTGNFTDEFDVELQSALVTYQNFFNLNVTGELDTATIDLISMPRCGVPDIAMGKTTRTPTTMRYGHRRSLYDYFPGRPTWPPNKRQLRYAFKNRMGNMTVVGAIFERAFDRWASVTPFSFWEQASVRNADITIRFNRIDGPGNTAAQAGAPPSGYMEVDDTENWWLKGGMGYLSQQRPLVHLESVMVHEIGHILGLAHSDIEEAVMYPFVREGTRKLDLDQDDLDGIWGLYGPGP